MLRALLLAVSLMWTSPALAVPYTYEFTTGGLTGQFISSFPFALAFDSYHITTLDGFVWDSENPDQKQFDNHGFETHLSLVTTFPDIFDPSHFIVLEINNLGMLIPNSVSGSYSFNYESPLTTITGTGDWERQAIPIPDILWPTLAGMIAIALLAERKRRQTHLVQ